MPVRIPVRIALPRMHTRNPLTRPLLLPPSSANASSPTTTTTTTSTCPSQFRFVHNGWNTSPPRSKHRRFNQGANVPARTTGPAAALKRRENTTPLRTGVLAVKKGMTSMFVGKEHVPCTVLQLDQVQVVANKTREKHGYWAVQIGLGSQNQNTVTSPLLGFYEAKGIAPKQELAEFMVKNPQGLLPVGSHIMPDWFRIGQAVDVRARSRGMGFAGGMKRHGFSGQGASHGNSRNHRTIGSVGQSQGGGSRVYPGKKMPGRMGFEWNTIQNLKVMKVDNELGIVLVSGPVPGPKGRVVKLQDAKKRVAPSQPFRAKALETLMERNPSVIEDLEAARKKHLEMKERRQSA